MIDKVINYISEYEDIDKSQLSADTDLIKDLDMTSLSLMQICCQAEEELEIEIPVEEIYGLNTIGELAKFLEELINN